MAFAECSLFFPSISLFCLLCLPPQRRSHSDPVVRIDATRPHRARTATAEGHGLSGHTNWPPPPRRSAPGSCSASRAQNSASRSEPPQRRHGAFLPLLPRRQGHRHRVRTRGAAAARHGAHCSRALATRRFVSPKPLRLPSPFHAPVARRARRPCGPLREAHDQTIRMLTVRMDGCALCSCV